MTDTQTITELLEEIEQDHGQATRKPRGFQYRNRPSAPSTAANVPTPASGAKPLPHQPKGRILTTLVFLSVIGFGAFQIWSSFFRYAAHGIVAANVIDVSAPIDGTILSMHVREGAGVLQGQLIATLHDLDAKHRLDRIGDQLRVAQATLSAEMAKLHWQMQVQKIDNKESSAEYFEAAARLEQEAATQQELEQRLNRAQKLQEREAITQDELDRILYDYQGQTGKVARLRDALQSWHERADVAGLTGKLSMEQIDPMLAQIDSLQKELGRARESLKQGEVRSPLNGRIAKWHMRTGEMASKSDSLFSVVEEGSSHIELYLTQESANRFAVGDDIELEVSPLVGRVLTTVERVGDDLVTPPKQIERFYSPNDKLLPVRLRLNNSSPELAGFPIGAHVRLPTNWTFN